MMIRKRIVIVMLIGDKYIIIVVVVKIKDGISIKAHQIIAITNNIIMINVMLIPIIYCYC